MIQPMETAAPRNVTTASDRALIQAKQVAIRTIRTLEGFAETFNHS